MAYPILDTTSSGEAAQRTVPLPNVRLADEGFWGALRRGSQERGVPRLLGLLEEHGVIDNFRRLAPGLAGTPAAPPRRGPLFTDSDLYKWIEAVGYVLQTADDPQLRATTDAIIRDIAAAQQPDGYLNTYYVQERAGERYAHLEHSHELYCAGHLIQGAVAYARATGDETLLQVARRFADHLCEEFAPGKRETTDGHPEIELALVELYRHTQDRRYLGLADVFLGRPQSLQNLPPIAERPALVGHCVRSAYICCGGADLALESPQPQLLHNLEQLWQDLVEGKIYVTGGVGARFAGEAFGEPYELPNSRAYAETCSQIGHFMWAFRMLLLRGDPEYAEAMEWILYNGLRSGVSLAGDEYFYMNPLSSDGGYARSAWHGCTCCPPNVQRVLASLPGYFLTVSDRALHVHLYDELAAEVQVPGVGPVQLKIATRYPWEEKVTVTVEAAEAVEFELNLRVPAWAREPVAFINDSTMKPALPGEYLALDRLWQPGDSVTLHLPMPPEAIVSHPRVLENYHSLALRRGPLVYCLESTDYDGNDVDPIYTLQGDRDVDVADLAIAFIEYEGLPKDFEAKWQPELLGGVMTIEGAGYIAVPTEQALYTNRTDEPEHGWTSARIRAIPYYAWGNRGPCAMRVWVRETDSWNSL